MTDPTASGPNQGAASVIAQAEAIIAQGDTDADPLLVAYAAIEILPSVVAECARLTAQLAQLQTDLAASESALRTLEHERSVEVAAATARAGEAETRLGMAWAFNAGGTFADRSDIQVRRSGPAGTHWFITRAASSNFDGYALQRDGSWGGRNPQPFPTADAAFAALRAGGGR